jgi:hypothetical protein
MIACDFAEGLDEMGWKVFQGSCCGASSACCGIIEKCDNQYRNAPSIVNRTTTSPVQNAYVMPTI